MIANSSRFLTRVDSGVYSSFKARTMHPRSSFNPGNFAISLSKQSPAVVPDDTSSFISVNPVRSLARAKNSILTSRHSFLLSVCEMSVVTLSVCGEPMTQGLHACLIDTNYN
ncbi:hypothetical protein Hanom_Chr01g00083841 [Helianthus anomalus]